MQPVTCRTCDNQVLVEKFSPVHTSVQWLAPAEEACPEFAHASGAGTPSRHVPTCGALRRSIDEAVRAGRVRESRYRGPDDPAGAPGA